MVSCDRYAKHYTAEEIAENSSGGHVNGGQVKGEVQVQGHR